MIAMERLMRARRRVAGCRACHGTGVVMVPQCTCGSGPWSPHEAYCGTEQCPHRCPVTASRGEAVRVWERHWNPAIIIMEEDPRVLPVGRHLKLRWEGGIEWGAGEPGCCGVWGYRTPWGALRGAWVLHRPYIIERRAPAETRWGRLTGRGQRMKVTRVRRPAPDGR